MFRAGLRDRFADDFGEPQGAGYVRDFFRFLGITDVEFLYAEGLALSETSRKASLAGALSAIGKMNAPLRVAA